MSEPNRKLPGPHDNVFTCTDNIYGFKAKIGPWKCGVKKDPFTSVIWGPEMLPEVTSQWLLKKNPKFSSNFYWLVMVGLEELHL